MTTASPQIVPVRETSRTPASPAAREGWRFKFHSDPSGDSDHKPSRTLQTWEAQVWFNRTGTPSLPPQGGKVFKYSGVRGFDTTSTGRWCSSLNVGKRWPALSTHLSHLLRRAWMFPRMHCRPQTETPAVFNSLNDLPGKVITQNQIWTRSPPTNQISAWHQQPNTRLCRKTEN